MKDQLGRAFVAIGNGLSRRADVEASGLDEADASAARRLLWWSGDRPKPPQEGAYMVAHDTGDGWYLHWTNDDGNELDEIDWPFGDDHMSASDLERLGFLVV